jgi:hypothetical protein
MVLYRNTCPMKGSDRHRRLPIEWNHAIRFHVTYLVNAKQVTAASFKSTAATTAMREAWTILTSSRNDRRVFANRMKSSCNQCYFDLIFANQVSWKLLPSSQLLQLLRGWNAVTILHCNKTDWAMKHLNSYGASVFYSSSHWRSRKWEDSLKGWKF